MKPHYLHNNMRVLFNRRKSSSSSSNNDPYINPSSNSSYVVPKTPSGRLQIPEYNKDNLFLRQQQQQQQQQQRNRPENIPRQQEHPQRSRQQQQQQQQPQQQTQHQQTQQLQQHQQRRPPRPPTGHPSRPPTGRHQQQQRQPSRQAMQHQQRPSSRSNNTNTSRGGRSSRNHPSSSSRSPSSSNRSQRSSSQQPTTGSRNTAAMTTTTLSDHINAVPSYVPASLSKNMSDDEASWISGVESHRSGGASASSAKNPYLRDGRATKRVIDDLNQAEDSDSVLSALSIICVEFDHTVAIKHNAELYFGAITVLARKLANVDPSSHDALRMICAAMEMAFRGGSKYVKEAYHINAPTLMPPLLRLLEKCEQSKVRWADEIILNITKCFHHLSKIPALRVPMARQPDFLDVLQRVTTVPLNVPSRNVRVQIMANLANAEENKVLLFTQKGFVNSLLKLSQLDPVDVTREYATVALVNLASASYNQIPLARNSQVLKVVTAMVASEKVSAIRENATTILQSLAFPKANRRRLVEFHDGIVVEALSQQLRHDKNEKARRRAAGALTNLAFDETAMRLAAHPSLLSTLATIATTDDCKDVQQRACLALTKIASSSSHESPYHGTIMDALVVAAKTNAENNIAAVFRMRAREVDCRERLARHPGVLKALAYLCTKPTASLKDQDNAIRALMHLTNENTNRSIMCTGKVLDAFVQGASCGYSTTPRQSPTLTRADTDETDEEYLISEIQDSAIRAIARLATEVSNRKSMARHEGLITAIAKATELESKAESLQSEGENNQQQSFLGKPLLMSLLLAL